MEINTKKDIFRATDAEVKSFFDNILFRGRFHTVTENDGTPTWAYGAIEDITVDGKTVDFCPRSLMVHNKLSKYVKNGACEFKASIDFQALRNAEKPSIKFIILQIKNIVVNAPKHDVEQERLFRRNLKLKNNRFVGQFTFNPDRSITIRDIRRSDFSKLILQNGKPQKPIVYHPHDFKAEDGKYYEFSWVLNGVREDYVYLFKVDETQPFVEVTPLDLVKRLHDDIMDYPAGAGQKIVKMLDTLKNQLTANGKEIFIYELLQNANDYPFKIGDEKQSVNVEFHLTLSSLIFMHTGAEFNEKNIAAICSINDKEKDTNKEAIGYKGIGFKTVFLDNDNVYLQTGGYSFRFDQQATKDIVDTPWQILPIWTQYNELTSAEKAIFTQASKEFRVKFSLRPTKRSTLRNSEHNYEQMFRDVFKNERVILFIPNLESVKVYFQGTNVPDIVCSRSNDTWRVDDFEESIDPAITEAINADINEQEDNGGLKIPTKYYDFKNTKVSFACEVDGRKLKAVSDTCLYCYLPAKDAKWGLKFLMNTDMIPNGARDDIEVDFTNTTNVNEEISSIAGSKLFEWLLKLCKSGQYELDSVFGLIPNFKTITQEHGKYTSLINLFKSGFSNRIKIDKLIPVKGGFARVSDVILDNTGISSSGIFSDEEFLRFIGKENKYLPVGELRGSKNLKSLLSTYFKELECEDNIFSVDSLHALVENKDFQEWLSIQENNDKFLEFLVEKEYLNDLFDKEIFIEADGDLYKAEQLYYDIDKYLIDVKDFTDYIAYLSPATRKHFCDNQKWKDVIKGKFDKFNCENFVNKTLLSSDYISDTIERLKNKETSIHFFKFLAENVSFEDNYLSLPFISDSDETVESFEGKFIFMTSQEGHDVCSASWLADIDIAFLSNEYSEKTIEYFKTNFGIQDFSNEIIIEDIVLSEEYEPIIKETIKNDIEANIAFVNYCYNHSEFIGDSDLNNYPLYCCDTTGSSQCHLTEDNVCFDTDLYQKLASKSWVDSGWTFVIDERYYSGNEDAAKLNSFLADKFGVIDIDLNVFYDNVVKTNIATIISNTSGDNDTDGEKNFDFISYLDENYDLIFSERKDEGIFSELVIVSPDLTDIDLDTENLYLYNTELVEILTKDWYPKNVTYLCNERYGNSKALVAIGVKQYTFKNFYQPGIIDNLNSINTNIDTKEKSIDFHSFIIAHLNDLTDPEKEKMSGVKVYLLGQDDPSASSSNLRILSAEAKDLLQMNLVEFSELNIVDPEYKADENIDYWGRILKNTVFDAKEFFAWLKSDEEGLATVCSKLSAKEISLRFFNIMAEKAEFDNAFLCLPFVDSNDKIISSFDSRVVFLSRDTLPQVCNSNWLSQDLYCFISADYSSKTIEFFKKNFGVREFSDAIIVKDIILSDSNRQKIADAIVADIESSIQFVNYCYSNKNLFEKGVLGGYALCVFDSNGDEKWCNSEEYVFFDTPLYQEFSAKDWMGKDWMYVLDEEYFKDKTDKKDFKDFMHKCFEVSEIDAKKFYKNIVRQNLNSIATAICIENDADGAKHYDFFNYLSDNYALIFEEEKDAAKFSEFKVRTTEGEEVSISDESLYCYDEQLEIVQAKDWFPVDTIFISSSTYAKPKILSAIGVKSYSYQNFFDDVIVPNIDAINSLVETKLQSIDFHAFLIANFGALNDEQRKKMQLAKVFLYGKDQAADSSTGHQILSASAKELFSRKLVKIEDLDIIDPDYRTEDNTTYWETYLENSKFQVNHFFNWLKNNYDTFSETLQDSTKNIEYWRWIKNNKISEEHILESKSLPIVLNNGAIKSISGPVYFSDPYLPENGIEEFLSKYDNAAEIISSAYIQENDNADDWKKLWTTIGVKYQVIDILTKTIIPSLSTIKEPSLPKLLADNKLPLMSFYGDDMLSKLKELNLLAQDGQYYCIKDVTFVNCEETEPFSFLKLPNQVSFSDPSVRKLMEEIIDEIEGDKVSTIKSWQQHKLDYYLSLQNNSTELVAPFHFQLIDALAAIRNNPDLSISNIEHINEILLLDRENNYSKATELTVGTCYSPFFDFESCQVASLNYVSDAYNRECKEYVGRLFRTMKMHLDFTENDIPLLEQREVSVYMWEKYLTGKNSNDSEAIKRRISNFKDYINSGKLNNLACIPTKDNMSEPEKLYYGDELYDKYLKAVENYENKMPLLSIPKISASGVVDDLMDMLPFKKTLDFLDALYALRNIETQEKRTQLLKWLIEKYDSCYDQKVQDYRNMDDAIWKNSGNKPCHISELYALAFGDSALEQYFGSNAKIINNKYFPSGDAFRTACDILGIKTISSSDLKMSPNDPILHNHDLEGLTIIALVLARISDSDNWKTIFESYRQKLNCTNLYRCKSISIAYKGDESICQTLKSFYHEESSSDFYYVKSLTDGKVYTHFVTEFRKYLAISSKITDDLYEHIAYDAESAIEYVKENNELCLDEDFKKELEKLNPGIIRELNGNIAEDEDNISNDNGRSEFTAEDTPIQEAENQVPDQSGESNSETESVSNGIEEIISTNEIKLDDDLQAPNGDEFFNATIERILIDGLEDEVVCEHYRSGTWVRGHWRNGSWVNGYWRNGSDVSSHTRTVGSHNNSNNFEQGFTFRNNSTSSSHPYSQHTDDNMDVNEPKTPRSDKGTTHDYPTTREPRERKSSTYSAPTKAGEGTSSYSDMNGWEGSRGNYTPQAPKPYSPEDVRNFGSHGVTRTLEVLEPTTSEVAEINRILGEDLSSEQVADQNYLAQLRLYNNLVKRGMTPNESKDDFVRNAHMKNEHTINGGKYIHKCSAAGGIMYLSPSIWNKIADDRCVVCVYLGAKSNEFMYFNSIDDILEWVGEDDIVIKLTGEEKADVVEELYSGVLNGVKGTAYTLIRINSNEKYNSLFAQLPTNNEINETEEDEDEY